MQSERHFSYAVIGGGPAGYTSALKLAELDPDAKICLVEKTEEKIGGTCLNEGCIPVKSLAESAELYEHMCRSAEYGLSSIVQVPEAAKLAESGAKNTLQLRQGILSLLKNKKVELFFGEASFLSATSVRVDQGGNSFDLTADKFIIASGSVPKTVPVFPVNGKNIVSSTELLKLPVIPKKLLVIGGGAIGCEFASIYRRLGTDVTVVEMLPHLLPSEDEDISRTLEREFLKKGITVMTSAKVKKLDDKVESVEALLEDPEGEHKSGFDVVLLSVGRVPNVANLGLDKAGIQTDNGFIPVDRNMKTQVPSIYAAGDVVDSPAYAHTASREGSIAAESASGKPVTPVVYRNIPRIVFTDPQVSSVGSSEAQAVKENLDIVIYKKFFKSNGKAVIVKNTAGFVKVIAEKSTGKVIGASIIGPSATELIHELVLAVDKQLTVKDVGALVHGHPTLSELTGETLS